MPPPGGGRGGRGGRGRGRDGGRGGRGGRGDSGSMNKEVWMMSMKNQVWMKCRSADHLLLLSHSLLLTYGESKLRDMGAHGLWSGN
jgi:hypothetical protein